MALPCSLNAWGQAIDPFVVNPDFEAKQIEKASKACTAICLWVRAMHKYNTVAKQVEPKRKLLAEKQARGYKVYARVALGTSFSRRRQRTICKCICTIYHFGVLLFSGLLDA